MQQRFIGLPIDFTTYDGARFLLARRVGYSDKKGITHWMIEGDFVSIDVPSVVWDVLPPSGLYWPALVLHNYFSHHSDGKTNLTPEQCDALALDAMEYLGVGEATRTALCNGLRSHGLWILSEEQRAKIKAEQVADLEKLKAIR